MITREQYLEWRNKDVPNILYEWYTEKYDASKHKQFLNIDEFFKFFSLYPPAMEVYNNLLDYYDCQFNVLKVPNKQGQYFMYI